MKVIVAQNEDKYILVNQIQFFSIEELPAQHFVRESHAIKGSFSSGESIVLGVYPTESRCQLVMGKIIDFLNHPTDTKFMMPSCSINITSHAV